jgi:glycosyltransferase involved in cell wall biosynthesis
MSPNLDVGGAQKSTIDLVKSLHNSGYPVALVTAKDGPLRQRMTPELQLLISGRSKFQQILKLVSTLSEYRKKSREQTVVVSWWEHDAIYSKVASLIATRKTKRVHIMRNVWETESSSVVGRIRKTIARVAVRSCDAIVCVSDGLKRSTIESLSLDPSRVHTIYNGIDFCQLDKEARSTNTPNIVLEDENKLLVLGVGWLIKPKGFDVLIKAFSRISRLDEANLLILGEGPELENLQRLAESLNLTNVYFPGVYENAAWFMARCDAYVLSSRSEGFARTVAEALALGAPVISTDCESGPKEIIAECGRGSIVRVDDEIALMQSLNDTLSKASIRPLTERFERLNLEGLDLFSLENSAARYKQLLTSM